METKNKEKQQRNIRITGLVVLTAALFGVGLFAVMQNNEVKKLEDQLAQYEEQFGVQSEAQLEAYREIENNLASISMHEGNIRENMNKDGIEDPKARVAAEIAAIEALIAKNNEIIADLNKKVDGKDKRINAYKSEVGSLKTRLSEYKTEMKKLEDINTQLADNLEGANRQVDNLSQMVSDQGETILKKELTIAEQDQKIHKAFYLVGDKKELRDKEIINKDGGILGIAASNELNPKAAKDTEFVEIDYRFLKRIPVFKKNAEIVTPHEKDSYTIVSDGNTIQWIEIKDPQTFWEHSKYLVVATKDGWI